MWDQWIWLWLDLALPLERPVGVSRSMLRVGRAAARNAAALMAAREGVLPDLDWRVRVPPEKDEDVPVFEDEVMPEDIPTPEEPEAADMVGSMLVEIVVCKVVNGLRVLVVEVCCVSKRSRRRWLCGMRERREGYKCPVVMREALSKCTRRDKGVSSSVMRAHRNKAPFTKILCLCCPSTFILSHAY
jgi:hypothetical protein